MGTVAKVFAKNVRRQTKFYFAHWLPSSSIEIGTVGEVVDDYFFRPVSTLADLGISFSPDKDIVPDTSSSPIDLVSSKSVSLAFKLAGEVNPAMPNIPKGKAGLGIEFSSEGAFIIKAKKTFEPRIRNVARLEKQILEAYKTDVWKKNYAVIYSIVQAPYADIIVSQSSKSGLELEAQASGQVGNVELGDAGLKFSIKKQSGTMLNMLESENVTPLFQLVGIKRKWFSTSVGPLKSIRPFSLTADDKDEEAEESLYIDVLKYDEK